MKCAIGGCGGAPTVLASGQSDVGTLAVTDGNAYWVAPDNLTSSFVMMCSTAGCNNEPSSVATVSDTVGDTYRFISDSSSLYMGGNGADSSIWSLGVW